MYRVLHIMAGADAGGISTVVLNYYQFMNRDVIHFDIAVTSKQIGQNAKKLKQLGCKFYYLPVKSKNIKAYTKELISIIKHGEYDAIHVHENETSYVALAIAKKMNIKTRIAHSHTSSPTNSLKEIVRRLSGCLLNGFYATTLIACGEVAGQRVFGKWSMNHENVIILPNAVDVKKFRYDENIRLKVRKDLCAENKLIIGMVCRLSKEKNCIFSLKIVEKLYGIFRDVVLIIVGNGAEYRLIQEYILENKMENYVKLMGKRSDVNELYQAFDIVLMPSIHEGFPMTAVEAIASGANILLSDTITRELSFGSGVKYLPLDENVWIDTIMHLEICKGREIGEIEIRDNHLDIRDNVEMLEKIYLSNNW